MLYASAFSYKYYIFVFAALPTSCEVHYPSEYSYFVNSIMATERDSANCTTTVTDEADMDHFVHCDGEQLRLVDSDLGSELYDSTDYYVWSAGVTTTRILFTFPARVHLTSLTLHYYSDSIHGLSKLRFQAVPDDFKLGDSLRAIYSQVVVDAIPPSSQEQVGRTKIAINLDFITKKVLLSKILSNFQLSVSEVEFFTCIGKTFFF